MEGWGIFSTMDWNQYNNEYMYIVVDSGERCYVFIAAMGYFQPVIKLMMNLCGNVINNKCGTNR